MRVTVALGMFKVWFESRGEKLPPLRCEKLNPYHPFVWLVILGILIVHSLKAIFWDFWKEIGGEFKTSKWG